MIIIAGGNCPQVNKVRAPPKSLTFLAMMVIFLARPFSSQIVCIFVVIPPFERLIDLSAALF
jgi:hypothetical protein